MGIRRPVLLCWRRRPEILSLPISGFTSTAEISAAPQAPVALEEHELPRIAKLTDAPDHPAGAVREGRDRDEPLSGTGLAELATVSGRAATSALQERTA
jgi:hypothetical protein